LSPGEAPWLLIYAPAAFIYRGIVQIAIAFYLINKAFIVGVILALWSTITAFVVPVVKAIKHVCQSPGLARTRKRALGISFGGAIAVLLFALLVPMPLHTTSEGVWLPDRAILRAVTDGFAERLLVEPGARVQRGEAVLLSEDHESGAQLHIVTARVDELRSRLTAQEFTDLSAAEISRFELSAASADLDHARLKARDLTLKSDADGTLMVPKSEDLPGRFFHQGEIVGYVLPNVSNRRESLQRTFQFDLAVKEDFPRKAFGSRVYVRFNHDWEPLGVQWFMRAKQILRNDWIPETAGRRDALLPFAATAGRRASRLKTTVRADPGAPRWIAGADLVADRGFRHALCRAARNRAIETRSRFGAAARPH
jgi:hypothetical protein